MPNQLTILAINKERGILIAQMGVQRFQGGSGHIIGGGFRAGIRNDLQRQQGVEQRQGTVRFHLAQTGFVRQAAGQQRLQLLDGFALVNRGQIALHQQREARCIQRIAVPADIQHFAVPVQRCPVNVALRCVLRILGENHDTAARVVGESACRVLKIAFNKAGVAFFRHIPLILALDGIAGGRLRRFGIHGGYAMGEVRAVKGGQQLTGKKLLRQTVEIAGVRRCQQRTGQPVQLQIDDALPAGGIRLADGNLPEVAGRARKVLCRQHVGR